VVVSPAWNAMGRVWGDDVVGVVAAAGHGGVPRVPDEKPVIVRHGLRGAGGPGGERHDRDRGGVGWAFPQQFRVAVLATGVDDAAAQLVGEGALSSGAASTMRAPMRASSCCERGAGVRGSSTSTGWPEAMTATRAATASTSWPEEDRHRLGGAELVRPARHRRRVETGDGLSKVAQNRGGPDRELAVGQRLRGIRHRDLVRLTSGHLAQAREHAGVDVVLADGDGQPARVDGRHETPRASFLAPGLDPPQHSGSTGL
jgi:hypothetical protein